MADDRPKHKPQKKHTLDEVLKSLQDLIRNDLIAAARVAGSAEPVALPPAEPASSTPAPDPFHSALDTLDTLIDHELVEPAKQARAAPAPDDLPDDENWPDDDTLINESLAADEAFNATLDDGKDLAPEASGATDEPEPARGVQDAFSFDDTKPADNGIFEMPATPVTLEPITETEPNKSDVPPRRNTARSLPEDDIPVLSEVAHEILAAGPELPTPEQARDIAVHVVARLNIELRKGGAQPLDPSTIDRLQQLLREALASKSSGKS